MDVIFALLLTSHLVSTLNVSEWSNFYIRIEDKGEEETKAGLDPNLRFACELYLSRTRPEANWLHALKSNTRGILLDVCKPLAHACV